MIPGRDAAGLVDEIGDGAVGVELGQLVFGLGGAAAAAALDQGPPSSDTASEANHATLDALGMTPTTYGPGLVERVRALASDGVDAALHAAASDALPDLVEIVGGDPTRVVTVIDRAGAARLGAHVVDAENDSSVLASVADLGRSGRYRPRIAHVVGLDDIAKAHEIAQSGSGEIVVTP